MSALLTLLTAGLLLLHRTGRLPAWPVALTVAGAVSNLVDRAVLGSVRDFLVVGSVVINVADVAVIIGLVTAVAMWTIGQPDPDLDQHTDESRLHDRGRR